jgi:hypothetical protein
MTSGALDKIRPAWPITWMMVHSGRYWSCRCWFYNGATIVDFVLEMLMFFPHIWLSLQGFNLRKFDRPWRGRSRTISYAEETGISDSKSWSTSTDIAPDAGWTKRCPIGRCCLVWQVKQKDPRSAESLESSENQLFECTSTTFSFTGYLGYREQRDTPTVLFAVLFLLSCGQVQWPGACNNISSTGRQFASSHPLARFTALLFLVS